VARHRFVRCRRQIRSRSKSWFMSSRSAASASEVGGVMK